MSEDVTLLLNAIEQGDRRAAGQLLPLVYDELRRLAARNMRRESPDHTLEPTALVHEAFVRLVGPGGASGEGGAGGGRSWHGRAHFFAAAATAMRRILIESARRKQRDKRGGGLIRQSLDDDLLAAAAADADDRLLALDEALTKLAATQPELARLVELRFFTGLGVEEAAELMGVSPRTAKRNWSYARAWLRREIERA